jgi:SNF2 family DNA or RNA helicase
LSERLDVSTFEAQFEDDERYSKRMLNDEFERLAFLNVRIPDLNEEKAILEADAEGVEEKRRELNVEIEELNKRLKALYNLRRPLDDWSVIHDKIRRQNKRTKEDYERERLRLLAEIEARDRLFEKKVALISSTANKPWAIGVGGKKALPHQIDGAHRMVAAERAILADKPGLGKTLQAIMTIDMLRAQGNGQKVLIFTPKPVVQDFERAFKQWTDPTLVFSLNQVVGKGVKTDILESVVHLPQIIIITNYEVWRKDRSIHQKLIECGFDTVILDEAHVLKDSKSKTSQDVREIIYAENMCPNCGGRANFVQRGLWDKLCPICQYVQEKDGELCSVKNVYPMTGTPILNKPGEIFFLLNLLDRKAFPSEKSFLNDYCEREFDYRTNKYIHTFGAGGSERLLKRLNMRYTGRTRESAGVVMPPQEVKHHWLELEPDKYPRQHKFVTELRDRARLVFSSDVQITQNEVLAWYMRMRMAASWPDAIQIKGCPHDPQCWITDENGNESLRCPKPVVVFPPPNTPPIGESVIMDAAEEITFEAVEDGDRIIVFSMFKKVIAELERRCREADLRVAVITGDVPQSKRQEFIDDFNINQTKVGEHKYDVLICQYGTASVGLNFSGAQQLLMIEREWNPGKEQQAMDRIRRLDSTYDSIIHVLHCKGTATDLIDAIQDQKKAIIEGFDADVDLAEAMRKFLEG